MWVKLRTESAARVEPHAIGTSQKEGQASGVGSVRGGAWT